MKHSYSGHTLSIEDVRLTFLVPVDSVFETPVGLLVQLKPISGADEKNIYMINFDGTTKWQIEPFVEEPHKSYAGYVSAEYKNDTLTVWNWLGFKCIVDINTGKLQEVINTK
jgi:hypothetical protein